MLLTKLFIQIDRRRYRIRDVQVMLRCFVNRSLGLSIGAINKNSEKFKTTPPESNDEIKSVPVYGRRYVGRAVHGNGVATVIGKRLKTTTERDREKNKPLRPGEVE